MLVVTNVCLAYLGFAIERRDEHSVQLNGKRVSRKTRMTSNSMALRISLFALFLT